MEPMQFVDSGERRYPKNGEYYRIDTPQYRQKFGESPLIWCEEDFDLPGEWTYRPECYVIYRRVA